MKNITKYLPALCLIGLVIEVSSCAKPNYDDSYITAKVPPIGSYNSSADVAASNLVAYWSFDTDAKESISGVSPSDGINTSEVPGIKGNALHFAAGYELYPVIPNLNTADGLGSVTVSMWVNFDNNGSQASSFFALTPAPDVQDDWGSVINVYAETGHPVSSDPLVDLHSAIGSYASGSRNGGDNINDYGTVGVDYQNVAGANKWIQYVMRYDGAASTIDIYSNGVRVSNNNFRVRTGLGPLVAPIPVQVLLGSFPNSASGFPLSGTQSWQALLTGSIDELRVYNKALDDNEIHALFSFERFGD